MKTFWLLTTVQLRALVNAASGRGGTRPRRVAAPVVWALSALLLVGVSLLYAFGAVAALPDAAVDLVVVLFAGFGLILMVFGGAQTSGRVVFGGKDTDFLLALPVPRWLLAAAKLAAVGLQNIVTALVLFVAAGAALATRAALPAWFWPVLIVAAVLLGLLATAAGLVLGLVALAFRVRIRSKALVNVLALAALGAFLAVIMVPTGISQQLRSHPDALARTLGRWLPPAEWVRAAAVDGALPALGLLALAGIVPLAVVCWLVGRSFVAVVTRLSATATTRSASARVPAGYGRPRSPFAALVHRELQRFFSVTMFFVNAGVGVLMGVAGAVFLLVSPDAPTLARLLRELPVSPGVLLGAGAAGILGTVLTTAPSLALEGDRLWILRAAPISPATVLRAKLALNALLTAPFALLWLLAGWRLGLGAPDLVVAAALGLGIPAAASELSLLAGLRWPNLDAPTDVAAVKQGVGVTVGLFGSWVLTLLAVAPAFVLPWAAGTAVAVAVPLAVAAVLWLALHRWGVRAFAALS